MHWYFRINLKRIVWKLPEAVSELWKGRKSNRANRSNRAHTIRTRRTAIVSKKTTSDPTHNGIILAVPYANTLHNQKTIKMTKLQNSINKTNKYTRLRLERRKTRIHRSGIEEYIKRTEPPECTPRGESSRREWGEAARSRPRSDNNSSKRKIVWTSIVMQHHVY